MTFCGLFSLASWRLGARFSSRVATTHESGLVDRDRVPDLARFLDSHVVLCYRNGHEWYDVHPLIRDHVTKQAAEVARRKAESGQGGS